MSVMNMKMKVLQLRRTAPLSHDQEADDAADIRMMADTAYPGQHSVLNALHAMAEATADRGLARLRMQALR